MSRNFTELTPQNFSFNSPLGWCSACQGLGVERGTELSLLIGDTQRSLRGGAITVWPDPEKLPLWAAMLTALGREFEIPLDAAFAALSVKQQRVILYGSDDRWVTVTAADEPQQKSSGPPISGFAFQYKGLYPAIDEATRISYELRAQLFGMVGEKACTQCGGTRLRDDAAAVRLQETTLPQLCQMPLATALEFLQSLALNAEDQKIAGDLLNEAIHRLRFLVEVGLEYLTLDRTMPTLSGGESQRIRLGGQIGRALTGVLYVLDEPTIGLHPRDNTRLIGALAKLRDLGNTVVLVEHDQEVIESADRLYDFGPGAGRFGGNITATGTPQQLISGSIPNSLTGDYLSQRKSIPIPLTRRLEQKTIDKAAPPKKAKSKKATSTDANVRQTPEQLYDTPPAKHWLVLHGARQHNLRNVDLHLPLGTLICLTGVSGSGKSSLILETLAPAIQRKLHRLGPNPGPHDTLDGIEHLNKVVIVDQQPLGQTPASNPATYTGVWDPIRELFARLPESKIRGFRPARFSFNRAGGRCDDCEGMGQKKIEMHFLPDVWIECTGCLGKRFNQETLSVTYKGRSISDVLQLSIGQALELFENIPKIRAPLATLCAIGLDYLTLGQSAPTLSGGEAQRVKLAAELCRPDTGRTLYLLDEPTTGLHFDDIVKLLKVLNSLVERGNTVVVIEHNLDVIKTADWIVDLGPEAGSGGGEIVAQGTPEAIVADNAGQSHTARLLAPILQHQTRAERELFDAAAVARKKAGDVELSQVGREQSSPWKSDGRQWHTHDRRSHQGKPCQWEGGALGSVIDQLAKISELAAPNWNHRSIVEIMSVKKGVGWFLHAQTGDEWLLVLKFRVRKQTFNEQTLQQELPLASLNDLPIYNRGPRVEAKNLKGPFQEIKIAIHYQKEVDDPAFQKFLTKAVQSHLDKVEQSPLNLTDLTPWKVLGRKWHLSRKGFPSQMRVQWEAEHLDDLFTRLESIVPATQFDYGNQSLVRITLPDETEPWAEVFTKRREGIDLTLYGPANRYALGRISGLGADREITTTRGGRQAIKIRLQTLAQIQASALDAFLREHVT